MFKSGAFSSDQAVPHRVNSLGLKALEVESLKDGLQVSKLNPLGKYQFPHRFHAIDIASASIVAQ
jgi:hypothetical protein